MKPVAIVFKQGKLDSKLSNIEALPKEIKFSAKGSDVSLDASANTEFKIPIHIKYLDGCENLNFKINLDKNSNIVILEEFCFSDLDDYSTNAKLDINLKENSSLNYYKLQLENTNSLHDTKINLKQFDSAKINMFFADFGSKEATTNINADLDEKGALCEMIGIYYLNQDNHKINNFIDVNHNDEHCSSSMIFKGVLDKKSSSVFRGKVYVDKAAKGTKAHQENHNLLLSQNSSAGSMPELEVYSDDVECTHGATCGELDDNALFYLRSRGIEENAARNILTEAFIAEIFENINNQEIKKYIKSMVVLHNE